MSTFIFYSPTLMCIRQSLFLNDRSSHISRKIIDNIVIYYLYVNMQLMTDIRKLTLFAKRNNLDRFRIRLWAHGLRFRSRAIAAASNHNESPPLLNYEIMYFIACTSDKILTKKRPWLFFPWSLSASITLFLRRLPNTGIKRAILYQSSPDENARLARGSFHLEARIPLIRSEG